MSLLRNIGIVSGSIIVLLLALGFIWNAVFPDPTPDSATDPPPTLAVAVDPALAPPPPLPVPTPTPDPQILGLQLIDELIECEHGWVRDVMVKNLQEDPEYVEFLQIALEICLRPTPTPTPEPLDHEFSDDSLMLLAAYHELVSFKDDVWFHIFCYAEASPAHTWSETMVDKEWDTYHEAGAHGDNLWNMGREYCESEGEETEFTRWVMGNMNADWINHRPVPTPSAAIRVTVGRPYRNVSEELASCLWVNRSMEEVFPEAYDGVESKAEMAELIEAALGTATDTTMFDGIITLWTVCESQ